MLTFKELVLKWIELEPDKIKLLPGPNMAEFTLKGLHYHVYLQSWTTVWEILIAAIAEAIASHEWYCEIKYHPNYPGASYDATVAGLGPGVMYSFEKESDSQSHPAIALLEAYLEALEETKDYSQVSDNAYVEVLDK